MRAALPLLAAVDVIWVARAAFQPDYSLSATVGGTLYLIAFSVGITAFTIGASMVGAEWSSGLYASLLTIEPRRARVAAVKVAVPAAAFAVTGLGSYILAVGGTTVVALTRRSVGGVDFPLLAMDVACGTMAMAGLAAIGAALATIFRQTAAALTTLLAYGLAGEIGVRAFAPALEPWLLSNNLGALLRGEVWVPVPSLLGNPGVEVVGAGRAGLYLIAITSVLVGAAVTVTVRRDAR